MTGCRPGAGAIAAPRNRGHGGQPGGLFRQASAGGGLCKSSQLMVDKLFTVPMEAVGAVLGPLEPQVLVELDLALRGWLELP